MKQKQYAPMSVAQMAASLYAADKGYLDDVAVDKIGDFEAAMQQYLATTHKPLLDKIGEKGDWNDALEAELKAAIVAFKKQSAI